MAVSIGRSLKSIVLAWMRAITLIGFGVSVFMAIFLNANRQGHQKDTTPVILASVVACACLLAACFVWLSTWSKRATYERAVKLATAADLSEEFLVHIELAFGRVSATEAEATLAELRKAVAEMRELERGER